MWRVILTYVVEIRFHGYPHAKAWNDILLRYIRNTREVVSKDSSNDEFFPMDKVKETMRLYPPTRSVYRQWTEDEDTVKADIVSCHHSKDGDAFGSDALCPRPERWPQIRARLTQPQTKKHEERLGFMPFAFHCSAGKGVTKAFGFKMVAILAGVVCEALDDCPQWELEDAFRLDLQTCKSLCHRIAGPLMRSIF